MPADAAEIVRLAERTEAIGMEHMRKLDQRGGGTDFMRAAADCFSIAAYLRARAAQHDHEVG